MNRKISDLSNMCEEEYFEYCSQYFDVAYTLTKEMKALYRQLKNEPPDNKKQRQMLWRELKGIQQKKIDVYKEFFDDENGDLFYGYYIEYFIIDERINNEICKKFKELKAVPRSDNKKRRILKDELMGLQELQEQNRKDFGRDIFDWTHGATEVFLRASVRDDIYPDEAYVERRVDEIEEELILLYRQKDLSKEKMKRAENLERELVLLENYDLIDFNIMNIPLFGCSRNRLLGGESNE